MRRDRAKRELVEKLELVDSEKYRAGLQNFKEHQESKVEYMALKNIKLEEMRKKLYA